MLGTGAAATVSVRLILPDAGEAVVVVALINQAFAIYPFLAGDRTSLDGLHEEMGDTGRMLVAERGGRWVGCAMVRPAADYPWEGDSPRENTALYFGMAAVERTEMRSGIGRCLVAAAEDEARRRGLSKLVLGTLREQGTLGYYESMGYRTVSVQQFDAGHWGTTIEHHHHEMVKEL